MNKRRASHSHYWQDVVRCQLYGTIRNSFILKYNEARRHNNQVSSETWNMLLNSRSSRQAVGRVSNNDSLDVTKKIEHHASGLGVDSRITSVEGLLPKIGRHLGNSAHLYYVGEK